MADEYEIVKYPLTTEKAVRMVDAENKLTFIVARSASKPMIKKAVQDMFKVKVIKVNTVILPSAKKKAYVTLSPETPARDVATQLGML
jgi:large subunit ribosomal protein L23